MPLIAVDGCTIQDTVHQGQCQVVSGMSMMTKVDGKAVCLDGLQVMVSGGTVPGAQTAPVMVVINAKMIAMTKFEGKAPLAVGDMSGGTEMGQYQVGNSVVSAPIMLTIADAGQTDVQAT